MEKHSEKYRQYITILETELVPALGCTEPIAIAYAAAKATSVLGREPQQITAACSGNIIKNVKGVIVPGTKDLRGIKASAILGAFFGDATRELEVLAGITEENVARCRQLLAAGLCVEEHLPSRIPLHILVTVKAGEESASVEIMHAHTNIVRITKNEVTLLDRKTETDTAGTALVDTSLLTVEDIYDFAITADIADVQDFLDRQIDYNWQIAEAGLNHQYGANVGATMLKAFGTDDTRVLAKAYAAAGSDARMSGCLLPVVINSGSGNQGMTASLPVIVYARRLGKSQEELYRALLLSNLIAIHQKTGIGRLSAYCGAVSAASGTGAAITYLCGGNYKQICQTITNTLANVSGIVCDGAKPSCAAKIASAVDAAILAHTMAMNDACFHPGEGIVKDNIEQTIKCVGQLASRGMQETDIEILKIMVEEE